MNTSLRVVFVTFQLWLCATIACAAEIKTPELQPKSPAITCKSKNFKFIAKRIVLGNESGEQQQRFYLIHNITNEALLLDHLTIPPGASAGWLARLRPQRWSAIAVDRPDFSLICTKTKPGDRQDISCEDVLKVCELKTTHYEDTAKGTYWVAEDKRLAKLIKSISARDIRVYTHHK